MRTLFAFNMMSLDGFFEGPDRDISWHQVDEEFNDFAIEQLQAVDLIIFGKVTYEGMASYWPTPIAIETDPAVANLMNTVPKIVVSKSLQKADWKNTTLIKDNARAEILKRKQQTGKDIAIFGSADLISSLMDIIDEHRVMINPVLLHEGTALFKGDGPPYMLKLISTRIFNSGNILLSYQPLRS